MQRSTMPRFRLGLNRLNHQRLRLLRRRCFPFRGNPRSRNRSRTEQLLVAQLLHHEKRLCRARRSSRRDRMRHRITRQLRRRELRRRLIPHCRRPHLDRRIGLHTRRFCRGCKLLIAQDRRTPQCIRRPQRRCLVSVVHSSHYLKSRRTFHTGPDLTGASTPPR